MVFEKLHAQNRFNMYGDSNTESFQDCSLFSCKIGSRNNMAPILSFGIRYELVRYLVPLNPYMDVVERKILYQSQQITSYLASVKTDDKSTIANGIVLSQYNAVCDRRFSSF